MNKKIYKNKKGGMVLRDVIFMIFIFTGIIAFSSILVNQMGTEYGNTNMTDSYNQDTIGKESLASQSDKWEGLAKDLSGENGILKMVTGTLEGAGTILVEAIKAPHTFSKMLTSTLEIFGVSEEFQNIAGLVLASLLYVLIIFSIIKVFLRGGDI